MSTVELIKLDKHYGSFHAVRSIDLSIPSGDFCVLVGPSGCGKSTTLRMVAGLEDVTGGDIRIGGKSVVRVAPSKREIAMVFQSYALYPHLTVAGNMGFSLKVRRMSSADIEKRVQRAARLLQIEPLLERKPAALSGGQRQRVAIGRAIVRDPKVFLFDEPLSNLDAALRVEMRLELAKLHAAMDSTMIYVTHDQVEAMTLADRIVVMNGGKIEQVGTPDEIFNYPRSLFVAGFIGAPKMNFLPCRATAEEGGTKIELQGGQSIMLPSSHVEEQVSQVGIRPEHLVPSNDNAGFKMKVSVSENLGSEAILYGDLEGGSSLTVRVDSNERIKAGDLVQLQPRLEHCHLFGSDGLRIATAN